MSKDEGGGNSSFSEKPVRSRPRRLVDWINPTGAKKAHSLIDKVYKRKNLEMAWEKVKENPGSGGVDGQNLEALEAQLNQQLDRLHQELKEDAYRPLPVRQHPIPKRDKPGEYRMLGIPAIYDRVCQQALLNRLEPIFEPVFDDASFGYRRGRSTKDALRKIWKEIQMFSLHRHPGAHRLAPIADPSLLVPPRVFPQVLVQGLPVGHLGHRHHVIPAKISSFSFHSPLLVPFARSAELRLEAPMRSEGDESRRLFSLVAAQYLLYCTLQIVIPTKSEYPPK